MSKLFLLSAEQKARRAIARERKRVRLAQKSVSWFCVIEAQAIIWLAERELSRTRYRYASDLAETIPETLRSPWIQPSTVQLVMKAVVYG